MPMKGGDKLNQYTNVPGIDLRIMMSHLQTIILPTTDVMDRKMICIVR